MGGGGELLSALAAMNVAARLLLLALVERRRVVASLKTESHEAWSAFRRYSHAHTNTPPPGSQMFPALPVAAVTLLARAGRVPAGPPSLRQSSSCAAAVRHSGAQTGSGGMTAHQRARQQVEPSGEQL